MILPPLTTFGQRVASILGLDGLHVRSLTLNIPADGEVTCTAEICIESEVAALRRTALQMAIEAEQARKPIPLIVNPIED